MRVNRRQLLVSAAVVFGLLVPALPPATAATDNREPDIGKRQLLQKVKERTPVRTQSSRPEPGSTGSLSRLAIERDSARVVIAVKVRPAGKAASATLATLAAVAGSARAQGGKQRRTLPKLGTVTVEMPEATAAAFTARMRGRKDVAKVELVPRRSLSLIPNDEQYDATSSYLGAVAAPAAWDVHRGDPGVLIAVVDSGVDLTHPDLAGRVAATYNGVTRGTDVTDTVGHGTFVAGVAAATHDNSIGIAGASMGANVLAVKVDDAGIIYADAVADGIIWAADHGAKVINVSLGSPTSSQVEREAIAYAIGKNVVVVAAAGNESTTAPQYPAAYPQVTAVGATDAAGARADFSSFGPWVTVAAPGVRITGTTPAAGSAFFPSTSGYAVADGTSFSSPIVAAEAALLWSLRPAVSASDIRQAIVKSSHGYANLGLGTGQVDFRAAYDALRPDSVPALTQPLGGASVAGVVRLSATSAAPKVRFFVNGVALGAPVATKAGGASTTWTSWGVANGPRTVTAFDCSIRDLCSAQSSKVSVTLANAAPALTSPKASQTLSGWGTFTATAPGGGVIFIIDGVRRGFDATSPYVLPNYPVSSLADGKHTFYARSCSVAGSTCLGPVSKPVSITAKSLHPKITAVSPSAFSPNGDGRYDTTRATYYLPDTEYVRIQVRNSSGTVVRGPIRVGTLTKGTRTFSWNGRLNSGARAAQGTYTLEVVTTRTTSTGTVRGLAVAPVRLDLTPPAITSISGAGTTFYPYPDSYKDSFAPKFTLGESATVTMTVRTGAGALVRTFAGARVAGKTSVAWNGKNTAGARVAAGTYYWTLTAQDRAGNRRSSYRYGVVVSSKHLVTKTATLSRRGSQYLDAGGSDPSCAWADRGMSEFAPYGVWLANVCDYAAVGPQIAGATYRFTLPAAITYTSLRLDTYGNSLGTSTLGAAFTRWATADAIFTGEITVPSANARRTLGTLAASGLVNASRLVETSLYVPNDYPTNDYDASDVRLVVTYRVFA